MDGAVNAGSQPEGMKTQMHPTRHHSSSTGVSISTSTASRGHWA
jgi:hypothetical protein